nr:acidic phospholipase A2 CM-II-like [Ciona intestinalis]|eukprot:XP_002126717.2 acidic phospholipase A2 CM-II-like [Ciona intestinalis]
MMVRLLYFVTTVLLYLNLVESCLMKYDLPKPTDDDAKVYKSQLGQVLAAQLNTNVGAVQNDYLNYGCYCGLGGQGVALDESDRCCQLHDQCYGKFMQTYTSGVYTDTYKYKFHKQNPDATKIECYDDVGLEQAKCLCDKNLAVCLQKARPSYTESNRGIRNSDPTRCDPIQ